VCHKNKLPIKHNIRILPRCQRPPECKVFRQHLRFRNRTRPRQLSHLCHRQQRPRTKLRRLAETRSTIAVVIGTALTSARSCRQAMIYERSWPKRKRAANAVSEDIATAAQNSSIALKPLVRSGPEQRFFPWACSNMMVCQDLLLFPSFSESYWASALCHGNQNLIW
jgi:hypothetical protein